MKVVSNNNLSYLLSRLNNTINEKLDNSVTEIISGNSEIITIDNTNKGKPIISISGELINKINGSTSPSYVTIKSSLENFTIRPYYTNSGILQYSLDSVNWNNISSGDTITSTSYEIYLRGKFNTNSLFNDFNSTPWELIGDNIHIYIEGDLNNLLNYENIISSIDGYAFNNIFKGWKKLINISNLKLPAIIIGDLAY